MLSQQELSDRAEIQDLIVAEASAMDRRDWVRWQECFTPDAAIDYSENDGAVGSPAEESRLRTEGRRREPSRCDQAGKWGSMADRKRSRPAGVPADVWQDSASAGAPDRNAS